MILRLVIVLIAGSLISVGGFSEPAAHDEIERSGIINGVHYINIRTPLEIRPSS